MDREDWDDLLALAQKGAECDGGHDGYLYEEDRKMLEKARAWLAEAEITP
jgi:hypothetical protein